MLATQTVDFFGAGGTLALNDLPDFHAAISGFDTTGSGDVLLIGGGLSFLGASETATAATLSFSGGRSLILTGDYVGGTFTPQSLSGGVLKITY